MARQQLTFQSIGNFAPEIVLAFNKRMKSLALDCEDRPLDEKARKLKFEVTLTPVVDKNTRECVNIEIDFACDDKRPVHRTMMYQIALHKNGVLVGNPDSPDNPDQQTFEMDEA